MNAFFYLTIANGCRGNGGYILAFGPLISLISICLGSFIFKVSFKLLPPLSSPQAPFYLLRYCPLLGKDQARCLPETRTIEKCLDGNREDFQKTSAFNRFANNGET